MYPNHNYLDNAHTPDRSRDKSPFQSDIKTDKMDNLDSYISSKKESIDNLYDTLKNEISPKKVSKNYFFGLKFSR